MKLSLALSVSLAAVTASFADTPATAPAPASALKAPPLPSLTSAGDEAGLHQLQADELTALDALIRRELQLAQQGGVRGFAGTFTKRRTSAEKTKTGLDRLTAAETERLDLQVASALASQPPPLVAYTPRAKAATLDDPYKGYELPAPHGTVSLSYGWAKGGRSFRDASVYITQEIPKLNATIGVGYRYIDARGALPLDAHCH